MRTRSDLTRYRAVERSRTVAARTLLLLLIATGLAGCNAKARLPVSAGIGPDPELPPPQTSVWPTVEIAPPWAGKRTKPPRRARV